MIYGTTPYHLENDVTDRIGIRTIVMGRLWQASRWPMTIAELDAEAPEPPEMPGGVLLIGKQTRPVRGGLRSSWTYEGINGDGRSVTFKDRSNSIDYRFEPGFSDKSMLLLPKIQKLMTQYGGYVIDGQIIWPPTVPGDASSGMKKTDDAGDPNPMFGRETFMAVQGTYLFRYMSAGEPSQSGVGKIHKAGLPGRAPSYADRDWLKLPVVFQRRGPAYENLEGYWLSEEGGWPTQIYGQGSTAAAGLSTGSLTTGGL